MAPLPTHRARVFRGHKLATIGVGWQVGKVGRGLGLSRGTGALPSRVAASAARAGRTIMILLQGNHHERGRLQHCRGDGQEVEPSRGIQDVGR
jgi:hypothetical protein